MATDITYSFPVGSLAYIKSKARKGIIEEVAIKLVSAKTSDGGVAIVYTDSLNSIYTEDMLCDHATALSLAIAYQDSIINS